MKENIDWEALIHHVCQLPVCDEMQSRLDAENLRAAKCDSSASRPKTYNRVAPGSHNNRKKTFGR